MGGPKPRSKWIAQIRVGEFLNSRHKENTNLGDWIESGMDFEGVRPVDGIECDPKYILKDNENISINNHKNEHRYQGPLVTETSLLFLDTNLVFRCL